MRILLAAAILATLAWGGYWFVGARALDRAVNATLGANTALTADSYVVRGFPNRFDLTLTEPRLTLQGFDWRAPFVQIFALSYRPHHVIAVFPHDMGLILDGQAVALSSTDMRASVVMDPTADLPLNRTSVVAQGPVLSSRSETHRADTVRLATRRNDQASALMPTHDWVIEAETVFPDTGLLDALDPDAVWPRRYDILRVEGQLATDIALDRHALSAAYPPGLTDLVLTGARVHWDGVRIDASGRLQADALGRLSGTVSLRITGVADLWTRVESAGLIAPEYLPLARATVSGLVRPAEPDHIDAVLVLRDGSVMFGPVPLLTLPRLGY